jgi:voltage-gated potassium channel
MAHLLTTQRTGSPSTRPDDRPGSEAPWRARLHEIIFEADTPAGRAFDVALIGAIMVSVVVVMLESVHPLAARYGLALRAAEWTLTALFTVEYVLRLLAVRRPLRYAVSFFGIVDLAAILPAYLSLFFPGGQYLLTIRVLRLLRIFRVLKLAEFLTEAHVLGRALRASGHKIAVFIFTVVTLVVLIGSVMYVVEGEANGFTSIPRSMYWAIVTLTTVGYGDLAPKTTTGQILASVVMVLGYGIIAVPTGIVTVELANAVRHSDISTQACPNCSAEGHAPDARYCRRCGSPL